MNNVVKASAFYVLWILLHYSASHLYTRFCTSWSIYGFLLSPFALSSPHCKALRWFMFMGSDYIQLMWVTIGALGSKYITTIFQ
jgi:hypothetical protein